MLDKNPGSTPGREDPYNVKQGAPTPGTYGKAEQESDLEAARSNLKAMGILI